MTEWHEVKEFMAALTELSRKYGLYLTVDHGSEIVFHKIDLERDDPNNMQYIYDMGLLWEYCKYANDQNS